VSAEPPGGEFLGRQFAIVSLGPSIFDRHIPAFIITNGTVAATELRHKVCCFAGGRGVKISDHRHRRLLRMRSERSCGRRATKERDELATFHDALAAELVRCQVAVIATINTPTIHGSSALSPGSMSVPRCGRFRVSVQATS
jgi:hypothetical protein